MMKPFALSASILVLAGGVALAGQPSSLATSNHWLASDIYKAPVYSPTHKKIGDVDDLILTSSGQINKAVIGVGQKEVVVPFADLKVVARKGAQELVLDRTKEQLKSAPSYDKTAMK